MKQIDQTGSQVFSYPRFAALLKTYLIENGKTLALYTAVLIGLSIIVGLFAGINFAEDGHFEAKNDTSAIVMGSYIYSVYALCFAISASFMFSTLTTRASRISTFMLPASMLEKFLVRFTTYFVLFALCFIFAMACGEATRELVNPGTTSLFALAKALIKEADNGIFTYYAFYAISGALTSHATYTLGSALWPKHSFIKTAVVYMALSLLLVSVIPFTTTKFFVNGVFELEWMNVVYNFAIAIVFYALAWWRFSTTQIVQRFMSD